MSNIKHQLSEFLKKHSVDKGAPYTHTRIPDKQLNIYGGKYFIPKEKSNEFYKIYCKHVINQNKLEFLTEKQNDICPIMIDLDFRYDISIETRQHTKSQILDIIDLYLTKISEIVSIDFKDGVNIYVFEKDDVNCQDTVTKDGIHIVFGISADVKTKYLIRRSVIDCISDVLEDLPLTNSYEDVIDKGVCLADTNWQVYGSCKPGNDRYKLKYSYNYDGELNEITVSQNDILFHKNISAQYAEYKTYEIKSEYKELYEKTIINRSKKTRGMGKIKLISNGKFPTNKEELDSRIEIFLSQLDTDIENNYNIREIHDYTMCLSSEYFNPEPMWKKVGWGLHNTSDTLFYTWMLFSSKSEKFDYKMMPTFYDMWISMTTDREVNITAGSIIYWARLSNLEEFEKIQENTVKHCMDKTLNGATEYDIAYLMHKIFKDKYKCASIKHKSWFEFKDHKWNIIDSGWSLRLKLSSYLSCRYVMVINELLGKIEAFVDDPNEQDKIKDKISKYHDIAKQLKKTRFKDNVMKECSELFYEKKFIDKLDKNENLMCFNNGVVDFKNKLFRNGEPDDYISISTNINFIDIQKANTQTKKEINAFMKQLFPDMELEKYMWEHLASVLIGTNQNQTFNIYTGNGRNGKSKLVELMERTLGDYKGSVPITLVTNKRQSIGSCSPEIAQLQGRRYAVMQEPTKGDKINEGIMKEITGGDPIQGRSLYSDTVTYVPQFSLCVCTNNLFDVKSQDEGTWRRMRTVPFKSYFSDNPDPKNKYQFKVDKNINEKFENWKDVFAGMLVEKVYETNGIVNDCDIVTEFTNKYRSEQDHITEFFTNFIIKRDGCSLKKNEVKQDFTNWYQSTYGGGCPKPGELYSYLEKKLGNYPSKPRSNGQRGWENYTILREEIYE